MYKINFLKLVFMFFYFHLISGHISFKESTNDQIFIVLDNMGDSKIDDDVKANDNKSTIDWIFIHGSSSGMHTYNDSPRASFLGLGRNLREKINGTRFSYKSYQKFYDSTSEEKQTEYKNKKNLFLKNELPLIMGMHFGFHRIDQEAKHIKNHITKTAYENILSPLIFRSKKHFHNNNFFMFNWAGDLSDLDRKIAADKLWKDLLANDCLNPNQKIIVGFSHGGNVMLEAFAKLLSSSTSKSEENSTFATKYLVLLGTPIGEKTKQWVKTIEEKSSIKIINLYSEGDIVQVSDFFFKFPRCERKIVSSNTINVNIQFRINGKIIYPSHEELYLYNKNRAIKFPVLIYLPDILSLLINNKLINNKMI